MPRPCGWSFMWVVVVAGSVWAGDLPEGEVTLTRRWRTVRQVVQRTAEQVKVRWAMPATISRRAFLGSRNDRPTPAKALLGDLARQTHLTCEVMNDVLVVHAPQDDRRTILIARLKGSNVTRKLEALCELGWLGDAQAWPALAAVAVGDEIAAALGAAQALRRLDGEEPLDWRVAGVSWSDPEFGTMADPAPAWQMPIGRAFPDGVPFERVEQLATSRYIPLREAAARLTASCGDRGKPLAEALARDRSPIVRTAATRTLRAWVDTDAIKPPTAPRLAGRTAWARRPVTNLRSVGQRLNRARKPETVWRLTGRRVGFLGTPQAIRILVRYGESDAALAEYAAVPLAEFCGGDQAIEFLRTRAAAGDGWASWGLGAMQDGEDLVASLRPILEKGRPRWDAPPEFTAARWGGVHAVRPLLRGLDKRGHWACLALGHIGDPRGVRALAPRLSHSDPGVAVAAARGLGDSAAHAAIQPLIANLKHPDRLRRHWAVLGLGRIGGPDAAKALRERLVAERTRKDRLVRRAAAEMLKEIGPLSVEAKQLIDEFEREDAQLVPAYRPRNPRFDERFPVNKEVFFKDHAPRTDGSTGETRVVMDWANRLMLRYGGANECVAFDVGTATWFPVRAASRFAGWNNELRPTAGGSGGMVYDGVNRLTWIGAGTGAGPHPGAATYGHDVRLAAYDAALDRFTAVPDVGAAPGRAGRRLRLRPRCRSGHQFGVRPARRGAVRRDEAHDGRAPRPAADARARPSPAAGLRLRPRLAARPLHAPETQLAPRALRRAGQRGSPLAGRAPRPTGHRRLRRPRVRQPQPRDDPHRRRRARQDGHAHVPLRPEDRRVGGPRGEDARRPARRRRTLRLRPRAQRHPRPRRRRLPPPARPLRHEGLLRRRHRSSPVAPASCRPR